MSTLQRPRQNQPSNNAQVSSAPPARRRPKCSRSASRSRIRDWVVLSAKVSGLSMANGRLRPHSCWSNPMMKCLYRIESATITAFTEVSTGSSMPVESGTPLRIARSLPVQFRTIRSSRPTTIKGFERRVHGYRRGFEDSIRVPCPQGGPSAKYRVERKYR